jgi:hypothetical protein
MNVIKALSPNILLACVLCLLLSACTTTGTNNVRGAAQKDAAQLGKKPGVTPLLKITAPSLEASSDSSEPPAWVLAGTGAYVSSDEVRVFYAVSSAYGISDKELLKKAADNGARGAMRGLLLRFSELAVIVYIKDMDEDELTLRGGVDVYGEELLTGLNGAVSKGALSSRVLAGWSATRQGEGMSELYSLSSLSLSKFRAIVSASAGVDKDLKAFIRSSTEVYAIHNKL